MVARARRVGPEGGLVLAHGALRLECERLQAALLPLQDAIASLDDHIEGERAALGAFERRLAAALHDEHALIARIDGWLRHVARLARLLADAQTPARERPKALRFVARQRDEELADWHARRTAARAQEASAGATPGPAGEAGEDDQAAAPGPRAAEAAASAEAERMRTVYRRLARRFHPDLARDEGERRRHGDRMAAVNELYARGDEGALLALDAECGEAEPEVAAVEAVDWPARVVALRERTVWLSAIVDSLEAERGELSSCQVAELRRAVEREARWQPRDPFANLRHELRHTARERLAQVPAAVERLEHHVKRARSLARPAAATTAVAPFDPHVGHALCGMGLQSLARRRQSPATAAWRERLVALSTEAPALMRLVLFAYVAERSRQPVEGLASFARLSCRFLACQAPDASPVQLAEALVQGDALVQYRIDGAGTKAPTLRLGLRDRSLTAAIEACLHVPAVREAFEGVLLHLGGAIDCRACRRRSFEVPLFCLRGLDDLRGTACARCGAVCRRYVLARGEDVQAAWNQAYLDLGLLYECQLTLGRRLLGLQVLGRQAARLSAADVLERVSADLFGRNGLAVPARELCLTEGGRPLAPSAAVARTAPTAFALCGRGTRAGSERAWCDELQYRIRTRWARPGASAPASERMH